MTKCFSVKPDPNNKNGCMFGIIRENPFLLRCILYIDPRYSFSTTDSEQLRMVIALLFEPQAYSKT